MTRVRSFSEGRQNVKAHETEVECYYQSVRTVEGDLLLHLSTFGSSKRVSVPKSSQSLQLDVVQARALQLLIDQTFGSLRDAKE
ncbi:conserved hypothetical protein [Plantibacter sp. T3]|nr:conserved hypothetical protein [Plantibacter sp. T3]